MRLPQADEPLVTDLAEDIASGSYATRQMRRKARRAEAKAARRRGMAFAADLPEAEPACAAEPQQDAWLASGPVEAQPEAPWITAIPQAAEFEREAPWSAIPEAAEMKREAPAALPAIEPAEAAPLPRNRALTRHPSGLAARLGAWFARLVPRKAAQLDHYAPDALAEQMLILRTELALVQMRLDRMIAATSA
jgi:hypothetical protein